MGKNNYSENTGKAVSTGYSERNSLNQIWDYVQKINKAPDYKFHEKKRRPYDGSPLEKAAYSASKDSYQTRTIKLAEYQTKNRESYRMAA